MKHTDQSWLLAVLAVALGITVITMIGQSRPVCLKDEVAVFGWNYQWGCARKGQGQK